MATPPPRRWRDILGNPFVLGAGALVIAVAAAIGVAVALGRGGADSVTILPRREDAQHTATPRSTADVGGERAKATTTLTVRSGPGTGFISLGVVARGTELEVVAKSDSEQWLEVVYPPRSRLRGWVELEGVEFSGDLAALPVGAAEVFALPAVPTSIPVEEGEEATATPASSAVDLVPTQAFAAGDFLAVTVANNGGADLVKKVIDVGVYDASLSQILRAARVGPLTLAVGESVDVSTGFRVEDSQSRRVVIVVNAGRTIEEGDYSNNSLVFVVTGGVATETPEAGRATVTPTRGPAVPAPTRSPTRTPRVTFTPTPGTTSTPVPPVPTETPTAELPVETPTAELPGQSGTATPNPP